jgi:hypothetical protein
MQKKKETSLSFDKRLAKKNHNPGKFLKIKESRHIPFELVVVDHLSSCGSLEALPSSRSHLTSASASGPHAQLSLYLLLSPSSLPTLFYLLASATIGMILQIL